MSNISQTAKVQHIVTADEEAGFVAYVPVLWNVPFNDTNYVFSWAVEVVLQNDTIRPRGANEYRGNSAQVSGAGFTAIVYLTSGTTGDVIVVHAMASHK